MIELRDIWKIYDLGEMKVVALRDASLSVAAGEFVALTGQSGSGKSTLMNILGCLDSPTSGSYRLAGDEVADLSRDQRARIRNQRIGFVFQNFNLLSRTSAIENVELPLMYCKGIPARERRQRAIEALERVGLGDRLHHHPSQLSGGQQQRVAIARALINRPAILMGDEPTGNLDSRTSNEVMQLFEELNRDQQITIMLVTHNLEIARAARRNVVLRDGEMICDTLDFREAARALQTVPDPDLAES
ncbi:MAG: ABC transporter ATP-binding protein [Planctomycetes bacterium]|nr:ABC transporter ATP-binding protein [Planctomycetota bacterium]